MNKVTITELLDLAVKNYASDLHLSSNHIPMFRIRGELIQITQEKISEQNLAQIIFELLDHEQKIYFEQKKEIDFSFEHSQFGRFRVHLFHHHQGIAAVFRIISKIVPTLKELGLPQVLEKFSELQRGLVLITGQTGMGKSTTLAAIIELINTKKGHHIVMLEDPIEYVFQSKRSLIHQRQVALHSNTFSSALKACLREDPNVIVIGEIRDLETIRLALTAAETGHLVLATLHTASAIQTIHRIVGVFESHEKQAIKLQLAESLQAIVSQVLIPGSSQGRIVASEILLATQAVKNLIREEKLPQIYSIMQMERAKGMQTLDQDLERLVDNKKVSVEQALVYAHERDAFLMKWKNFLH